MPTLSRRRSVLGLGALCGAPFVLPVWAQSQARLPDRALRILVGFSAGGGAELVARIIAPRLELRTGRHVTIENKPNDRAEPAGEYLKKGLLEGSVVAFLPTTTIAMTGEFTTDKPTPINGRNLIGAEMHISATFPTLRLLLEVV